MTSIAPRAVSRAEFAQGHVPCDCGRYTHVTSADLLRSLPRGYSGECCAECGLWMCAVDRLPVAESPTQPGCGYPYCGGNSPECRTCQGPAA